MRFNTRGGIHLHVEDFAFIEFENLVVLKRFQELHGHRIDNMLIALGYAFLQFLWNRVEVFTMSSDGVVVHIHQLWIPANDGNLLFFKEFLVPHLATNIHAFAVRTIKRK